MKRIANFLITVLALVLTAWLVPGIEIVSLTAGILAALILGIVNTFIKPILTLFTLPLTVLTFGLFLLVINGMMLSITASLVSGFQVAGFWAAVFGSLVLSIVNGLMSDMIED